MVQCPKCFGEAADGSRFCPSCATPLDASGSAPTHTSVEALLSHPSLDRSRFVPGSVLDKRSISAHNRSTLVIYPHK
jgi:hypothetical protein